MVEHKSNAAPFLAVVPDQSRKIGRFPLTESRICGNGESVWVHVNSPGLMKAVYAAFAKELGKRFSVDDDSLQSDPHKGFKTVDFFGVWARPRGQREPEELGTVSLFSDDNGNHVMKINPAMPGAVNVLIEALSPALVVCVERLPDPDVRITVEEGHDFRFK